MVAPRLLAVVVRRLFVSIVLLGLLLPPLRLPRLRWEGRSMLPLRSAM